LEGVRLADRGQWEPNLSEYDRSVPATKPAKKRVLICDDDPVILRLLQVNLELEGYEALLAHHGAKAVEVALAERPDLVILDIMMPRMDGYEALQNLKANELTKTIPVIFLSAKAQPSDIEKGKNYGVDDYITKPFDPAELLETVERLVR
jgi:DNA-binding response OmpR family regulator